jgi:hypothetical protein
MSVDPLQATVDAVLERSGSLYSVEQVTACVMSMYDRCIRYDDPDSVLEQLSLVIYSLYIYTFYIYYQLFDLSIAFICRCSMCSCLSILTILQRMFHRQQL